MTWSNSGRFGALGTNNDVTFHGATAIVEEILNGTAPADIPYREFPTAWLAVNLSAAAEIGLTFPQAVPDRANEVIE